MCVAFLYMLFMFYFCFHFNQNLDFLCIADVDKSASFFVIVDGGFSDWTTWDACTVVCGGGTKNRTRSCNNPEPLYLGAPCIGHTNEQQICNTHLCRGMCPCNNVLYIPFLSIN